MYYSDPVARLIEHLRRLPAIGPKSAQRLAFHILKAPDDEVRGLLSAIANAKAKTKFCSICYNITESDPCAYCSNPERDHGMICVVEEFRDVLTIERTREYHGVYHVLHGAISPIDGIGPDELKVRELVKRVQEGDVREVIVATDPNTEGETTALYLARLLNPFGILVTRPASGLPVGGDLEFADEATLARAMEARRQIR